MKYCIILLIDTPQHLILLKEASVLNSINIIFHSFSSVSDAKEAMNNDTPDLLLIGSGKLMEDLEILHKAKDIPIVILCETEGFDVLLKNSLYNVLFITMPFDLDNIPEIFKIALEFWAKQRKRGQNV